jgi:hypothetical protein
MIATPPTPPVLPVGLPPSRRQAWGGPWRQSSQTSWASPRCSRRGAKRALHKKGRRGARARVLRVPGRRGVPRAAGRAAPLRAAWRAPPGGVRGTGRPSASEHLVAWGAPEAPRRRALRPSGALSPWPRRTLRPYHFPFPPGARRQQGDALPAPRPEGRLGAVGARARPRRPRGRAAGAAQERRRRGQLGRAVHQRRRRSQVPEGAGGPCGGARPGALVGVCMCEGVCFLECVSVFACVVRSCGYACVWVSLYACECVCVCVYLCVYLCV